MYRRKGDLNGLLLFCSLFATVLPAESLSFVPRGIPERGGINKRACEKAVPGVSEQAIINDACSQNPQNSQATCANQITTYVQSSARNTCSRYYGLYNDCLNSNSWNQTTCSVSRSEYLSCSDYTLRAYAYCGCYYNLPTDLYNCANLELEVQPQNPIDTSTIPTSSLTSTASITGPIPPSTATATPPPNPSSSPTSPIGPSSIPTSPPSLSFPSTSQSTPNLSYDSVKPLSLSSSAASIPPLTLYGPGYTFHPSKGFISGVGTPQSTTTAVRTGPDGVVTSGLSCAGGCTGGLPATVAGQRRVETLCAVLDY